MNPVAVSDQRLTVAFGGGPDQDCDRIGLDWIGVRG